MFNKENTKGRTQKMSFQEHVLFTSVWQKRLDINS